jgi:1-acyl-sn-glycerol-3-phosphate acyltransferase
MYLLRHDCECIKLLDRKGFVRLAVQHGTPLLPVYHFGLSRMLNYGPKVGGGAWPLRILVG